jgi:hypothetical protein
MRSALFWDVTQRRVAVQVCADVSGQRVDRIFKNQEVQEDKLEFLTFEDGTGRLSRNVGTELTPNAA